jgi:hypothetical protein
VTISRADSSRDLLLPPGRLLRPEPPEEPLGDGHHIPEGVAGGRVRENGGVPEATGIDGA